MKSYILRCFQKSQNSFLIISYQWILTLIGWSLVLMMFDMAQQDSLYIWCNHVGRMDSIFLQGTVD